MKRVCVSIRKRRKKSLRFGVAAEIVQPVGLFKTDGEERIENARLAPVRPLIRVSRALVKLSSLLKFMRKVWIKKDLVSIRKVQKDEKNLPPETT